MAVRVAGSSPPGSHGLKTIPRLTGVFRGGMLAWSGSYQAKRAKGLSFDEKRKRLCELFYESKEFYNFKELEKLAPKQKGIVSQSVKEVLDSLLADNIVDTDKIGTSVLYWAFPSKASQIRKRKIQELTEQVAAERTRIKQLKKESEDAQKGREDSTKRKQLATELEVAEREHKTQEQELLQFKENDPDVLNARKKIASTALAAANRWTDNIFSIQSYCSTHFNISGSDFLSQFDLPETFDSISEADALAPPPAASAGLKWKKASEEAREQGGDDADAGGDMD